MGNCKYCGKPAGFLKSVHKECERRHSGGINQISIKIACCLGNDSDLTVLGNELKDIARQSYIDDDEYENALIKGWEQAVEKAFDDNILTKEEEKRLVELKEHFSLTQDQLDINHAYSKVAKGAILRDILEGKIPDRLRIDITLPFNFQKKESIVWVFQNVPYYEKKTKRRYEGGYAGVSMRVANGLYFRTGGFKGHPVDYNETVHIDTGIVAVTTKHIYFSGEYKTFRIRFDKIIAFTPYSDGIEVQKDGTTAKPQIFVTGDGWFSYNLLTNLANMEK